MIYTNYTLIEIEEEKLPLAPTSGGGYFGIVLLIMCLLVLLLGATAYVVVCCKYRSRIRELGKKEAEYYGWNLHRLKKLTMEMELKKTEDIVEEMQKIGKIHKNIKKLNRFQNDSSLKY